MIIEYIVFGLLILYGLLHIFHCFNTHETSVFMKRTYNKVKDLEFAFPALRDRVNVLTKAPDFDKQGKNTFSRDMLVKNVFNSVYDGKMSFFSLNPFQQSEVLKYLIDNGVVVNSAIASSLGISETSVRKYRKKFGL